MATKLFLTTPCRELNGHYYFLCIEEDCGETGMFEGEEVKRPWLRAACSCGWKASDKKRFTLEENAVWWWTEHVKKKEGAIS